VTDLHILSGSFSINVWRKLVFPCMKFCMLNYMEQDNILVKTM
jgi:hypothetical protein